MFKFYGCSIKSPTIPQAVISPIVLPSIEDMARVIKEVEGTPYEVFFRVSMYGLRRSEVLALTINDLDGTTLTINKAMGALNFQDAVKSVTTEGTVSNPLLNLKGTAVTVGDGDDCDVALCHVAKPPFI